MKRNWKENDLTFKKRITTPFGDKQIDKTFYHHVNGYSVFNNTQNSLHKSLKDATKYGGILLQGTSGAPLYPPHQWWFVWKNKPINKTRKCRSRMWKLEGEKELTGRSGSQSVRWGTSSKSAPPEPVKILLDDPALTDIDTSFLDTAIPEAASNKHERSFFFKEPQPSQEPLLLLKRSLLLLILFAIFPLPTPKQLSDDEDNNTPPFLQSCSLNPAAAAAASSGNNIPRQLKLAMSPLSPDPWFTQTMSYTTPIAAF